VTIAHTERPVTESLLRVQPLLRKCFRPPNRYSCRVGGGLSSKLSAIAALSVVLFGIILMTPPLSHSTVACESQPASTSNVDAYFSAKDLADGPLDECGSLRGGARFELTHSGPAGFYVDRRRLTSDSQLSYLNFGPLQKPVREAWIEVSWSDNGDPADPKLPLGEPTVLIVSDGPFATNFPRDYANAAAHMLIFRDRFVLQKRAAAGPGITLATQKFPAPLARGERHRLGVVWDGRTITVVGPAGQRFPVAFDVDVLHWWGPYGCVEIVGSNSGRDRTWIHEFKFSS
jgi:hypothetical protein